MYLLRPIYSLLSCFLTVAESKQKGTVSLHASPLTIIPRVFSLLLVCRSGSSWASNAFCLISTYGETIQTKCQCFDWGSDLLLHWARACLATAKWHCWVVSRSATKEGYINCSVRAWCERSWGMAGLRLGDLLLLVMLGTDTFLEIEWYLLDRL